MDNEQGRSMTIQTQREDKRITSPEYSHLTFYTAATKLCFQPGFMTPLSRSLVAILTLIPDLKLSTLKEIGHT
jgi:hypothetical protein